MKHFLIATTLLASALISGCSSTMNIGEDSFSCPGNVDTGFKCMGVRDLYKATEGPSDSFGKAAAGKDQQKNADDKEREDAKKHVMLTDAKNNGFDPTPWMDKPLPVRSQAKVMRIWVAPYEDESGDLNAPGLAYTEIEGRKWNVGEGMVKRPVRMSALNSPAESVEATGTPAPFSVKSSTGKDISTLKNVTPQDAKSGANGAKQGKQ